MAIQLNTSPTVNIPANLLCIISIIYHLKLTRNFENIRHKKLDKFCPIKISNIPPDTADVKNWNFKNNSSHQVTETSEDTNK